MIIDCQALLKALSKQNGFFLETAMMTADPFAMCTNDDTFFHFGCTKKLFQKLFTLIDPKTHESCSAEFINKNRMSVITTLYGISVNLWNSANCDECYAENYSDDVKIFSNSTNDFLNSLEVYNDCVKNVTTNDHINNTFVCTDCVGDYQSLNAFYEKIKKETNGKICFDLEDKVSCLKINSNNNLIILILCR